METAETLVNRAPRQRRLDAERAVLLDAILHAQLVLSVHRISKRRSELNTKISSEQVHKPLLEKQLRQSKEKVRELEIRLEDQIAAGEAVQEKVQEAKKSARIHFEAADAGHSA